jgi:hypothetical protein
MDCRVRLKLSKNAIAAIQKQAEKQGVTYSFMCSSILAAEAAKLQQKNQYLLASAALIAKIDIANSFTRFTTNNNQENETYHKYPQAPFTCDDHQHCTSSADVSQS